MKKFTNINTKIGERKLIFHSFGVFSVFKYSLLDDNTCKIVHASLNLNFR